MSGVLPSQRKQRYGTARDLEEATGGLISRRRAWKMARDGELPPGLAIKIGRNWFFDIPGVLDWLARGGSAAAPSDRTRG